MEVLWGMDERRNDFVLAIAYELHNLERNSVVWDIGSENESTMNTVESKQDPLQPHKHSPLLFDEPDQWRGIAVPFFQRGFETNESTPPAVLRRPRCRQKPPQSPSLQAEVIIATSVSASKVAFVASHSMSRLMSSSEKHRHHVSCSVVSSPSPVCLEAVSVAPVEDRSRRALQLSSQPPLPLQKFPSLPPGVSPDVRLPAAKSTTVPSATPACRLQPLLVSISPSHRLFPSRLQQVDYQAKGDLWKKWYLGINSDSNEDEEFIPETQPPIVDPVVIPTMASPLNRTPTLAGHYSAINPDGMHSDFVEDGPSNYPVSGELELEIGLKFGDRVCNSRS
ncbi:hypothetical protein PIB30_052779 [Stylosanthes scabra]|uniref:Uncharacterized protein n=1 Tax=Stylosanthes scabra TaxID=79078 RepID=A0ABU6SIF1_9FABA|nr:hypothetical protein [Stylosanthes scabra]